MSIGEIIEAQNDPPILGWYVFQNPLAAAIMAIALLAEVNRAPFDLPEAEQELTAGYHTEYSGMKFALFYMAEYIGMVAVSMIGAALYFGGYHFVLVDRFPLLGPVVYGIKVVILLMVMIWVRGTLPRIRYDRLMSLGWKVMLPFALLAVAWSSASVIVAQELDNQAVYIGLSILASVLFVIGALIFFDHIGRKPEVAPELGRVQVVELGGGDGMGAMALRAADKVAGLPGVVVSAVTGGGDDKSARQDRVETDEKR
jgi:formate hydrogenlyase subunit 4